MMKRHSEIQKLEKLAQVDVKIHEEWLAHHKVDVLRTIEFYMGRALEINHVTSEGGRIFVPQSDSFGFEGDDNLAILYFREHGWDARLLNHSVNNKWELNIL